MIRLDDRVACITGGTRSIGRGMAEAFLAAGARVVINGRDEAKGAQCLEELGAGERAAFFAGDASSQAAVEGLVDFTVERYGRIDICCLNSGGVRDTATIAEMTDEEWALEVDWNLNQVFWGMRRALGYMLEQRSGRILVTSSVEGKLGKPGLGGYVATKHAVNGLVKAVAREVGTTGITVNAILPGLVETDIIQQTGPDTARAMGMSYDEMVAMFARESALERPNTVEEVAAAATLLVSDAARNITGCLFPVDGGTLPY